MTVRYLDRHFRGRSRGKKVLVIGMGSIGRKTAHAIAERKGYSVSRVNRTLHPGARDWHTLDELPGLSRNADALVIESTYMEEEAEMACQFSHLTARMAAELALKAKVKKLMITHISRRYREKDVLKEAQAIFPNSVVARDFDSFQSKREE